MGVAQLTEPQLTSLSGGECSTEFSKFLHAKVKLVALHGEGTHDMKNVEKDAEKQPLGR